MKTIRKTFQTLLVLGFAASLLFGCQSMTPAHAQAGTLSTQERIKRGKALFDEKCQTVAGEKIYKTVPDVEGVLLLKIRPRVGGNEWADPMWPGAAFALESTADEFIMTFLGYEHSSQKGIPVSPNYRGYIGTDYQPDNASNLPGYRYVDIIDEKDGQRYRYRGRWYEPWQEDKSYLKGYIKFALDKTPAPNPTPRYTVTYEDHVVPEERALGLASSTIRVIDRENNETLGEMTRYAWSAGAASPANPSPWLTAYKCPGQPVGSNAATRKFVDQILIPKKGQ